MLKLYFLGRPQVTLDELPVLNFVSEKVLALLSFLALQQSPTSRETLAGLLWGDMPEPRAKANLRMALYNLQQLLPGYVVGTRLEIGFNRDKPYWMDVADLQAAGSAGSAAARSPDLPALRAALDGYRGDFLEGLFLEGAPGFEEWLYAERGRLQQAALQLALSLTDLELAERDYPQAIHALQRALSLEPWQEGVHRKLMLVLARSGDLTGALAQYHACRRSLGEGLGVEPEPETVSLYERVRAARALERRHNLPQMPTPFVGREIEQRRLAELLDDPSRRLVVIVGPGGVGKTRLALQAAADQVYACLDGVIFVPLAELASWEEIVPAILSALEVPLQAGPSGLEQLVQVLGSKETLLVLDNFERLVEGAVLLGELLHRAPQVRLLVTSRQRLNLTWETVFPLDGMDYPRAPGAQGLESCDAARLFLQSARRVQPDFSLQERSHDDFARVCRLSDGLPLALELVGASAASRPLVAVRTALEQGLDLLATEMQDVPDRHRSLQATIDYSWQLLSPADRSLFVRLCIFRGGFTQEAARQVAGAEPGQLKSLAAKSMLHPSAPGRFEMHPMLHQFGLQKLRELPQERFTALQDRHSEAFAGLLQHLENRLVAADRLQAMHKIRADLDNVRAAWRWAVASGRLGDLQRGWKALARFYEFSSLFQEGEAVFRTTAQSVARMLEETPGSGASDPVSRPELLLGDLYVCQAQFQTTLALYEPALAALHSAEQIANVLSSDALEASVGLRRAELLERQGDFKTAGEIYARIYPLAKASGQPELEAAALNGLGIATGEAGDVTQAEAYFRQALALSRALGDLRGESVALHNLGIASQFMHKLDVAREYYRQQLAVVQELGNRRHEAMTLLALCQILAHEGAFSEMQAKSQAAVQILLEIGDRRESGTALLYMGKALLYLGRFGEAEAILRQAMGIGQSVKDRQGETQARLYLSVLYRYLGANSQAHAGLQAALEAFRAMNAPRDEIEVLSHLARLHYQDGEHLPAQDIARQALALAQKVGEPALEALAWTVLGHTQAALGRLDEAGQAYRQGLALRRQTSQEHLAFENLAGLAYVDLKQGEPAKAAESLEPVVRYLEDGDPDRLVEPLWVLWACYRVLRRTDNERALTVLSRAHQLLSTRADTVDNIELRRSFLESVPLNVRIAAEFRNCFS